jgi:hypothetical protein
MAVIAIECSGHGVNIQQSAEETAPMMGGGGEGVEAVAPSRAILGDRQWVDSGGGRRGSIGPGVVAIATTCPGRRWGVSSSSAPLSRPRPRHCRRLELPLSRRGASAGVSAAKSTCKRIGASSMGLHQTENPCPFYPGSRTSALAAGMLNVISDDHTRYVGCVNFLDVRRLAKLQMKLRAGGEFVATNEFDFSLTNHANMGLIAVCGGQRRRRMRRVMHLTGRRDSSSGRRG